MAQWFYDFMGQPWGPVSDEELVTLARRGVISPGTSVREVWAGATPQPARGLPLLRNAWPPRASVQEIDKAIERARRSPGDHSVLKLYGAAAWGIGFIALVLLIASGKTEAAGPVMGLLIAPILLAVYFWPTIQANRRGHPHAEAIMVANTFFGWTFIGWVLCLVWASMQPGPRR